MHPALERKLGEEFDFMKREYDKKPDNNQDSSYLKYGCQCENGWYKLIRSMLKEVVDCFNQANEPVSIKIYRIKQSGVLKFQYGMPGVSHSVSESIYEIKEKYVEKSKHVCEICGRGGELRKLNEEDPFSVWETLCDIHYEKYRTHPSLGNREYGKNYRFLDELIFIAENISTGKKITFTYDNLYGCDDGLIYLQDCDYSTKDREELPVSLDDSRFIFRLREPDDNPDIYPVTMVYAEIISEYGLRLLFSTGVEIEFDFTELFNTLGEDEKSCDFGDYIVGEQSIRWINGPLLYLQQVKNYTKDDENTLKWIYL